MAARRASIPVGSTAVPLDAPAVETPPSHANRVDRAEGTLVAHPYVFPRAGTRKEVLHYVLRPRVVIVISPELLAES